MAFNRTGTMADPETLIPVVRDVLHMTEAERHIYRAGLAEGFRQGVQAAAEWITAHPAASREGLCVQIRALRPEGEK